MPIVKICGLKDEAAVAAALRLPVDYIGFVFAPSKRRVTPARAGELIRAVESARAEGKPAPRTVGVFVDPTLESIGDVLREAPLDIVQLHGSESPDFCRRVKAAYGVGVWRVCSVSAAAEEHSAASGREAADAAGGSGRSGIAAGDTDADAALSAIAAALDPYAPHIDGLMLDTAGGGTGKTFEWERIPPYQAWARRHGIPLLVAGGLHPDNVAALIETFEPDGVDVSSGVETDGTKDVAKITAFVERVKRHESHASA